MNHSLKKQLNRKRNLTHKKIMRDYKLFFLIVITAFMQEQQLVSKNVKIGFLVNYLAVTGIEVAIYDYADCNESILDNESLIIVLPIHNPLLAPHPELVRNKFMQRFGKKYYECSSLEEMDKIITQEHIDILYMLRGCGFEHIISKVCKNAVHVAFMGVPLHGDRYVCVSQWIAKQCLNAQLPYVPHMIRLPETLESLRNELSIPNDALVFGRYGGEYGFDIDFVKEAITEIAQENPHIYFLFMNTPQFCNLPNVIYLPATADMLYKAKFINSCDAMIHARTRGETFGLACGEFSIKNKPVITWIGSPEKSHIDILGKKAIYYTDKNDFIDILRTFKKNSVENYDAYSIEYSPESVMKKFNEVFIQPLIKQQ